MMQTLITNPIIVLFVNQKRILLCCGFVTYNGLVLLYCPTFTVSKLEVVDLLVLLTIFSLEMKKSTKRTGASEDKTIHIPVRLGA